MQWILNSKRVKKNNVTKCGRSTVQARLINNCDIYYKLPSSCFTLFKIYIYTFVAPIFLNLGFEKRKKKKKNSSTSICLHQLLVLFLFLFFFFSNFEENSTYLLSPLMSGCSSWYMEDSHTKIILNKIHF